MRVGLAAASACSWRAKAGLHALPEACAGCMGSKEDERSTSCGVRVVRRRK